MASRQPTKEEETTSLYQFVQPIGEDLILVNGKEIFLFSTAGELLRATVHGKGNFIASPIQDRIRLVAVSSKYIGFAADDKLLVVFDHQWNLLLQVRTIKKLNKAIFDGQDVLCCDKFGDVYRYKVPSKLESKPPAPRLLLGHVSICTDILLTQHSNRNVLCSVDRDEKLRISEYPNSFEILAFGLLHTEFISRVCELKGNLITGGGDDYLAVWTKDAKLIQKLELTPYIQDEDLIPLPEQLQSLIQGKHDKKVCVTRMATHETILVLVLERVKKLIVCKWERSLKVVSCYQVHSEVVDCQFDKNGDLFITERDGIYRLSSKVLLENAQKGDMKLETTHFEKLEIPAPEPTIHNLYETSTMRKWSHWNPEHMPGPVDEEALHAKRRKTKRGGTKQKTKKEAMEDEGVNKLGQ
jgi:hypothetical protein